METKKKSKVARLSPRFHHGSWWAYDRHFDSDAGPYSSREQAQDWIDSIQDRSRRR